MAIPGSVVDLLRQLLNDVTPGYPGYPLEHYSRTLSRAGGDEEKIMEKFPYICSYESLLIALRASNITFTGPSHRNPNGYTAEEMAETIIDRFDQIMYDTWYNTTVYQPKAFDKAINAGYRWDQHEFWDYSDVSLIYHNGNGAGVDHYVLDNVEVVLLPPNIYQLNTAEYKQKPFLGFDVKMMDSQFGAELDLISATSDDRIDGLNGGYGLTNALVDAGSFVVGVEYNIREVGDTDFTLIGASQNTVNTVFTATGAGTGTGKARETAGTIASDVDNPIPADEIHPSLMYVYDYQWYHADLNENGVNSTYYGSFYDDSGGVETSLRYYDKSVAKFEVTLDTATGKVTAITPVARDDGDGNPVTGGWGYSANNDYQELAFGGTPNIGEVAPRVLFRTNQDQPGYSGNKATVDITDANSEFYAGKGLDGGSDIAAYAYAVYGIGSKGYQNTIEDTFDGQYDDWFERNWPTDILPSSVRVRIERPTLVSTTRSLKSIRVGTGAHRYGFEFEYPPMTYEDFTKFNDAFELARGSQQMIQIGIPSVATPHPESLLYNARLDVASNYGKIIQGTGNQGDDVIVVNGLKPGYSLGGGFYFTIIGDSKLYRCIKTSTVDEYGRMAMKIEPPLLKNNTGQRIRMRTTNKIRADFLLMKAFIVEDTFEWTVDAAGYYRFSIKFVEAV